MRNIITVDGSGGVGKGTLCLALAQRLNWQYLDSGALYRVLAFYALLHGKEQAPAEEVASLVKELKIDFELTQNGYDILLNGQVVSQKLRSENCSITASIFAAYPEVRKALLYLQQHFAEGQSLIADGRDMGTVIFPQAQLKIFLTADAKIRAQRRYNQLKAQGETVNLNKIFVEITARDARDSNRTIAPLKPASDAVIIDTGNLSVEDVLQQVLDLVAVRFFCN